MVWFQVFNVPLEERKYKEMSQQSFGEKGGEQAKICQYIISLFGKKLANQFLSKNKYKDKIFMTSSVCHSLENFCLFLASWTVV